MLRREDNRRTLYLIDIVCQYFDVPFRTVINKKGNSKKDFVENIYMKNIILYLNERYNMLPGKKAGMLLGYEENGSASRVRDGVANIKKYIIGGNPRFDVVGHLSDITLILDKYLKDEKDSIFNKMENKAEYFSRI